MVLFLSGNGAGWGTAKMIVSDVVAKSSSPGKFFLYMVFMFLTFAYFTFYGMMAVGLTPNQQMAAVVSSAFYSLWNLISGFLVPKPVSLASMVKLLKRFTKKT